ncbi:MAG: N-acetylmuramoyl-L-alanine amidase [Pseudomonadota bacterium]
MLWPSPNFGERRGVGRPRLVVLHYTGMPSFEGARDRLADPAAEVSAHYLIAPDGRVLGMVAERDRAWHAGRSAWADADDVNSASLGIELAHPGGDGPWAAPPFPERQMAALERVLAAILARWSIPPAAVLAHSDVAPGRKIDPGETFDWARLARRGLAAQSAARPAPGADGSAPTAHLESRFRHALRTIGYGDWPTRDLLDAFRRRWRPSAVEAPSSAAGEARAPTGEDVVVAEALARGPGLGP